MNKKKFSILIKTNGSNKIGMGHIVLSIALAKKFKEKGFKIFFLTPKNEILRHKLAKFGTYKSFLSKSEEVKIINQISPDIIIIIINISKNYFSPNLTYIKNLKKICKLLITLEYTGKAIQYADVSFNSLIFTDQPKTKKSFQGIEFCPIRNEFVKTRKQYRMRKKVRSVVVLQGGSDTKSISLKLIKYLEKMDNSFKITIIVGAMSGNYKKLKDFARTSSKNISILYDVKKISSEMKKHDIAISAAGTTLIELLTIGIPTIITCGEMHEIPLARTIQKQKAAINLGYGPQIKQEIFIKNVESLLNNFKLRKELSTKAKKIADGEGLNRILEVIIKKLSKAVTY